MAKQEIKLGRADFSVLVFIPDPASTDGSGKTGLNAAALTVSYVRLETDNDVTVTDVTSSLNNLSALTDAHNDWGVKEVSNTLAPGLYRLDLADAVLAAGIWSAVVYVMITTSEASASPMEFIAVAYDPLDTVRLGLTALPNAAADAAGGLVISDAGGLDADAQRADVAAILVDTGTTLDARIPAALVGGRIDANVGAISSDATAADNAEAFFDGTGYAGTNNVIPTVTTLTNLPAITANWLTAAGTAADFGAEVADALLNRDMSTGTDSGSTTVRTPRQAFRVLRNKVDLATTPGTMDVKKEDDSTSSWTATLTTSASADPITIIDPAGP